MIVLDTDVLSALRRPERAPQVAAWLRAQDEAALRLSAVTVGEVARGVERARRRDPAFAEALARWLDETATVFADRVLPFGAAEARIWGRLSARIGHDGADLMIAATALAQGAAVATGNARHYAPTGVALVDPFAG
ncbi:MAG: type II toxin-antitoxin system VapC family toxin [Pseudomonadota bacterium]